LNFLSVLFNLKVLTLTTDLICFFRNHEELKIPKVPNSYRGSALFIDCRVIQIFLRYKAICYSDKLKEKIKENGKNPLCYFFTRDITLQSLFLQR